MSGSVPQVVQQASTNGYALLDANFNTVALLDPSGSVTERYSYSSFGIVSYLDSTFEPLTESAYDMSVLFAGSRMDQVTGTYYVRNRYYSPYLGRWITRDPLDNAEYQQGPNLYLYVGNDPINQRDSSGLGWNIDSCFNSNLKSDDPTFIPPDPSNIPDFPNTSLTNQLPTFPGLPPSPGGPMPGHPGHGGGGGGGGGGGVAGLGLFSLLSNITGLRSGLSNIDYLLGRIDDNLDFAEQLGGLENSFIGKTSSGALNDLYSQLATELDASYTAEGSYTVYGYTGLTGAGADLTLGALPVLGAAAFAAGYLGGTALINYTVGMDTYKNYWGNALYNSAPELFDAVGSRIPW